MPDKFWISTGDIRETYSPLNVVGTKVLIQVPLFGQPDVEKAYRDAVDNLARSALKLGANGVIWIRFADHEESGVVFRLYASGTAVRVLARMPES